MLTNREMLDKISSKELAVKIKSLKDIPGFEYIDWELWLKSESPELPYVGEMIKFKPFEETFAPCEWVEGTLLDSQIISGIEYNIIISEGVLYKIPNNRVKCIIR